jgi:hypothetical protein
LDSERGGEGNVYVVNGRKIFTTFEDQADYHLLYARFGETKGGSVT